MIHPQRLSIFAAIVQAGGVRRAATELGCDKSVVSRHLSRLEAELGSQLIQRTTRGLALTRVGALVLEEAKQIDGALARIEQLTAAPGAQAVVMASSVSASSEIRPVSGTSA